jgi:hypothetical protein
VLFTFLLLAQPTVAPAVFVGVDSLDGQVDPALARRISHALHGALGLRPSGDEQATMLRSSYDRIQETFRTGAVAPSAAALERMCRRTERTDTPWTTAVVDLLAEMRMDLGQMQLLNGNKAAAAASFRAHHALRPEQGPNPKRFRPNVIAAYERLALAPLAGAKRGITINSEPIGAIVTLDGRSVGVAPVRLDGITLGTHLLRIELGDRIVQQSLVITRESPPQQTVRLGADPRAVRAAFAAWRNRRGAHPVGQALKASGFLTDGGTDAWLVGISTAGTKLNLVAARFAADGTLQALNSETASKDLSDLANWTRRLKKFATQPSPPLVTSVTEQHFGRAVPARRRGLVIAAAAVATVGVIGITAAIMWSRQQDYSGIVINPESL